MSDAKRRIGWMELAVMLSQSEAKRTQWEIRPILGWSIDGGEPFLMSDAERSWSQTPACIEVFQENHLNEFRWVSKKSY